MIVIYGNWNADGETTLLDHLMSTCEIMECMHQHPKECLGGFPSTAGRVGHHPWDRNGETPARAGQVLGTTSLISL